MSIHQNFNLPTTETVVVFLDRYSDPLYTVQVTTGSALVQGTMARINRGETPTWETLDDKGGTALTALTDMATIETGPFEAIRITATGTTVGSVSQTGAQ